MFSNTAIQLQAVFAQWIQNTHALAPGATAPGATASTSLTWGGGDLVAVGGKVALLPIPLGTDNFLVHHIHAFTIHMMVLILLKGVLFARSSYLISDKANLGFNFLCNGPRRGDTCKYRPGIMSSLDYSGSWQGNFESWVQDPLHVRPIAHAIWDPHFGQPAMEAFSRGGALGPMNIAYSSVYQWWYTIDLRTNQDVYTGALFLLFLSSTSLIVGCLHLQPKLKPSVSWFKNAESHLNHHLSGLFGISSLAWTGHLVHVAIPASRGEYVHWNNFLDVLPHPQGLGPLFIGQWNFYAQNLDSCSHLFGTVQGAGTAILTLLGGFHPQT
ncbi:Photosystem I chlorophyll a apoprotein A2 [Capsicum baccatum]|uniref:Photosystem I chlorophyll a apoprotein A2 n=1 Tax=Capsicum baccatum TaxID=33114 RepID=A0A2G2WI70_CAPBA|nr:Photosystem I chlorophyll a apoprotein A2 [Capsicum baccatum]